MCLHDRRRATAETERRPPRRANRADRVRAGATAAGSDEYEVLHSLLNEARAAADAPEYQRHREFKRVHRIGAAIALAGVVALWIQACRPSQPSAAPANPPAAISPVPTPPESPAVTSPAPTPEESVRTPEESVPAPEESVPTPEEP